MQRLRKALNLKVLHLESVITTKKFIWGGGGGGRQGIFVLIVLYRRVVNRKCAFACAFILPLLLNNYSFAHRTVDDKRGNIFNLLVSCVGLEKLGAAIKEAIVECLMLQMCKIGINRRHEVEIESQRSWYLLKSNCKDVPGP